MADENLKNYLDPDGVKVLWDQIGALFVRKTDYDAKVKELNGTIESLKKDIETLKTNVETLEKDVEALKDNGSTGGGETTA